MVITQPTIDDFKDTTVMRVIRKVVNYIVEDLVPSINQEQKIVTAITPSLDGNILTITLTFDDDSTISGSVDLSAIAGGGGSSYVLPPATKSTLGGIIVGNNLTVDGSGKVNAPAPYNLPIGGTNIGGVKNGGNVTIETDGTMNASGDGWEALDLDNIPTDFASGDEVEIVVGVSLDRRFNSPDNWNTTFSGAIELRSLPDLPRIAKIKLASGYAKFIGANVSTRIDDNFVEIISINVVEGIDEWNNQSGDLFRLEAVLFNGAGNSTVSYDINRANIKTYVTSMKRKKATQ